MTIPSAGVGGILILHAWMEPDGQLRVRLTSTGAIEADQRVTVYASSTAEVQRIVGQWLEHVAGEQGTKPATPS